MTGLLLRGLLFCLLAYGLYGAAGVAILNLTSDILDPTPLSLLRQGIFLLYIAGFTVLTAMLADWLNKCLHDKLLADAVLDRPNERSMHALPVPRGGGWSFIVPLMAMGLYGLAVAAEPGWEEENLLCAGAACLSRSGLLVLALLAGFCGLALISWRDDRGGVAARWRLLAQLGAVGAALLAYIMAHTASLAVDDMQWLFPSWPFSPWLLLIPALLVWVGFINLYNFMDGIDGISAVETLSLSLGLLVLMVLQGLLTPYNIMFGSLARDDDAVTLICLALTGCSLAFLRYNWHPARLFQGDVGSVPVGFALGFVLFSLCMGGYWTIALTLPFYYLADGGITLLRRLLRGEKIWQPHRTHFYQRAAQAAGRHDVVVRKIALCNVTLILIAALELLVSPWLVLLAPLPVAWLLHNMANQRHSAAR